MTDAELDALLFQWVSRKKSLRTIAAELGKTRHYVNKVLKAHAQTRAVNITGGGGDGTWAVICEYLEPSEMQKYRPRDRETIERWINESSLELVKSDGDRKLATLKRCANQSKRDTIGVKSADELVGESYIEIVSSFHGLESFEPKREHLNAWELRRALGIPEAMLALKNEPIGKDNPTIINVKKKALQHSLELKEVLRYCPFPTDSPIKITAEILSQIGVKLRSQRRRQGVKLVRLYTIDISRVQSVLNYLNPDDLELS